MPETITPTSTDLGAKVAGYQHPHYVLFSPVWQKLVHAREGTGGFLDGSLIQAHPREWEDHTVETPTKPTKKLKARRALACYENFAATIIEAKSAALFREQPARRVGEPDKEKESGIRRFKKRLRKLFGGQTKKTDLELWWDNVDGRGTHIDDFMAWAWDLAATFGHVWLFLDKPSGTPATTAADTPLPFIRLYTPLDVLDWLEDEHGRVIGLKFQEVAPRNGFSSMSTPLMRTRTVTTEEWTLYDEHGKQVETGKHEMGRLPAVPLFARRRPAFPQVGLSVLGDPQLYVDVYNLTSEIRELLRNQTFSFINIPLGTGDGAMGIEEAKTMLGQQTGTMNVVFSGEAAQILTGDSANITAYHEEIARRLRTIYRLAGIQWESDSKDAEAEGSLELKREDMNTRLAKYADELEKTDYELAELVYRAKFGADAGKRRFEADAVLIRYPDSFDMTPFEAVLEQAEAAMSLNMPSKFLKELRKSLVPKFLPDLDEAQLKEIYDAIDAAEDDPTAQERLKMRIQAIAGGKGEPPKVEDKAA